MNAPHIIAAAPSRALVATGADGNALHADAWGPEDGLPVICLPGLTRNARDFAHLARVLSGPEFGAPRKVIVLEARGRGRSGRAESYSLVQEFGDLVLALDAWGIEQAQFVGTSRGGLATMLLATRAPELIERVVLNDIGPTLDRVGLERIARSLSGPKTYPSNETYASALMAALGPQFPRLTEKKWRRFAAQLASENGDGSVTLDYDPALADGYAGFDASVPPDFWPAFDALKGKRVLVIRGAHSDLLSAATVEAMRRRHHGLQTHIVGDEGHAPLLWDRASCETIKGFLA